MPDQFRALTVRDFYLKHEAFMRAEGRQRSADILLALLMGNFSKHDRARLEQAATALRRYPLKSWMLGKKT